MFPYSRHPVALRSVRLREFFTQDSLKGVAREVGAQAGIAFASTLWVSDNEVL
ncbi:MAG: hypothetical protein R2795_08475 [Saprospiraceae bacterium]